MRARRFMQLFIVLLLSGLLALIVTGGVVSAEPFVHPGCLSTEADLQRMARKVSAGEQPWKASWDILVRNTDGFLDDGPGVQAQINAGRGGGPENYMRLARDCAKAYELALRYYGSGDPRFADKAVEIMNVWAAGHTGWGGDTNVRLRAGLYGYQFACAAELLRDYKGWKRSDFKAFQTYMLKQFYPHNKDFLEHHHGTVASHYWANWDLANMCSMLAIGVLCDDHAIFDEAVDYYREGIGNGAIGHAVQYVHPGGLGQWQESGRDQGHSLMGPQLMGTFCEIAWNQGIDLYSAMGNRFLSGVEYISKYNLGHEVPFVTYVYRYQHPGHEHERVIPQISEHGRGMIRPGWDLIYNHYVNRMGMAAPWTRAYAEKARPEGGGFNYGGSSGGFDGLGFTTLTHSLDPIETSAPPSALRPNIDGSQVTLSWTGSAYAESYNVKRSARRGGPYETLATVDVWNPYYIDAGLTTGKTYYYVVSANTPSGETDDSEAAAVKPDSQLHGKVVGTDGSWHDSGADKFCVFDGWTENYFDAPSGDAWVGLDLGEGVRASVYGVKYCPRKGFAGRMVGGKFQASNNADFSGEVLDLFTVRSEPVDDEMTTQQTRHGGAFRYVRYVGPSGSNCDVAEVQYFGRVVGLVAPAAPTGLTAKAVDMSRIDLEWDAVPGADTYCVTRMGCHGGPDMIVGYVTEEHYCAADLRANTAYLYRVTAINPAGASPASDEAGATTTSR